MFAKFSLLKRLLLPASALLTSAYLNYQYHALETTRANKPELIRSLKSTKQEMLLLIYNRESEAKIMDKIIQIEGICDKVNIGKLLLVDQTDVRHLEVFARILREDIEQGDLKKQAVVDLEGKIDIMYVNPQFDTLKPFKMESEQTIQAQVQEIRGFVKVNPTPQQLKNSFNSFSQTTVLKNCYNSTCLDEYKQKVRQLIQLELLRGKSDYYKFYVTSGKPEAQKLSSLIPQSSNKQEIYVHHNDMLGQHTDLFSEWLNREGSSYSNSSQFMMMIRPKVHVISKANLSTDIFWYMSAISANSTPTFSINNSIQGLYKGWTRGHPEEIDILKNIKNKFGNKVELMVIDNPGASELLRHSVQPWRYTIFKLTRDVPYPKMAIDIESPANMESAYEQINTFLKNPKNYNPILMYTQLQKQINAQDLVTLLNNGEHAKFIFRMCGPNNNNCVRSLSQVEDPQIPIYKLDGRVQNIGIDSGDYLVEQGNISPLFKEEWEQRREM